MISFFHTWRKTTYPKKTLRLFPPRIKHKFFLTGFSIFSMPFFVTLVHKSKIKNNELFKKSTLKKTFLIITISTWAGLGDARWSLALGRDIFPGLF